MTDSYKDFIRILKRNTIGAGIKRSNLRDAEVCIVRKGVLGKRVARRRLRVVCRKGGQRSISSGVFQERVRNEEQKKGGKQMSIIDYIPKGKGNKISRQSLVLCTGLPDRSVRRLISAARADGHAIVGDPTGGYYMAETEGDIRLLLSELSSRIGKLARCYTEVRKHAAERIA